MSRRLRRGLFVFFFFIVSIGTVYAAARHSWEPAFNTDEMFTTYRHGVPAMAVSMSGAAIVAINLVLTYFAARYLSGSQIIESPITIFLGVIYVIGFTIIAYGMVPLPVINGYGAFGSAIMVYWFIKNLYSIYKGT